MRDVDLEVTLGERRAILGPNGAGKTTLFNVVCGDFVPTSGSIELFGQDVTPALAAAGQAGPRPHLPAVPALLGLTVEDNIYLSILGVKPGTSAAGQAAEAGWGDPRSDARGGRQGGDRRQARRLSARSRTASTVRSVAVALAPKPRLLMLDEPASGLSRGERVLLTDLLLALDREITLILIEHDMDVALRVAERVTMMHDGRVIVEGTPDEIRANQLVHDLYLGQWHSPRDEGRTAHR